MKQKRKAGRGAGWASAYLFILPSLVLLIAFHIVPIFMTVGYSFCSYNVLQPPEFVGLANYRALGSDPYISSSLFNLSLIHI